MNKTVFTYTKYLDIKSIVSVMDSQILKIFLKYIFILYYYYLEKVNESFKKKHK